MDELRLFLHCDCLSWDLRYTGGQTPARAPRMDKGHQDRPCAGLPAVHQHELAEELDAKSPARDKATKAAADAEEAAARLKERVRRRRERSGNVRKLRGGRRAPPRRSMPPISPKMIAASANQPSGVDDRAKTADDNAKKPSRFRHRERAGRRRQPPIDHRLNRRHRRRSSGGPATSTEEDGKEEDYYSEQRRRRSRRHRRDRSSSSGRKIDCRQNGRRRASAAGTADDATEGDGRAAAAAAARPLRVGLLRNRRWSQRARGDEAGGAALSRLSNCHR
uniref:Uncharacterized protein n=1 Tax=Macrostomum lignano TaxID=282301 RepID=A0A1I8FA00_9PLAT